MKKISILKNKTKLVRPLLDEKKQDLTVIAKKYFGKIFKDPSNSNRKFLRTKIRGLIEQFEKSGIKHERVISSINNLGSTRDTLNTYVSKIEKSCITRNKKEVLINLKNFLAENEEIQLKIFGNCIKNFSRSYYPPRAKKIINLLNKIKTNEKLRLTLGGCVIRKINNNLAITKEKLKKSLKI
jgi:tRNA(Ile)-lysidine synthase